MFKFLNKKRIDAEWHKVSELEVGMLIAVPRDGVLEMHQMGTLGDASSNQRDEQNQHGDDILWDEIESIEYVGTEQVWDIEVEGTHNFIGNNIFAHNTYLQGNLGVGINPATAGITIGAGSDVANGAPLKFTSGALTTGANISAGAVEWDGTRLRITQTSGPTRQDIAYLTDITGAAHNAVTLGTANGLSLATQVLSLGLASSGVTGALSGTDWNTFNNKQTALTNPVTGTGTLNYLSKFTATGSTIGNSQVYDNGTNVGIGTTAPLNRLDVYHDSAAYNPAAYNATGMVLSTTSTASDFSGIRFTTAIESREAFFGVVQGSVNDYSNFVFQGYDGVSNTFKEYVRIDQSGNVGIGTTNPSTFLHIVGNTDSRVVVDTYANGGVPNTGFIGRSARGTASSPTALLLDDRLFSFSGKGYTGSAFSSSAATIQGFAAENFSSTNQGAYLSFWTTPIGSVALTGTLERMRILDNGNVGIGTTAPAYKLDVANQARIIGAGGVVGAIGGTDYVLSLQNNGNSSWLEILNNGGAGKGAFFGMSNNRTANSFEIWNYQAGSIDFFTETSASAGTNRMRIASNGNVGIGTTNPTEKLEVNGNAYATSFYITGNGAPYRPGLTGGTNTTSLTANYDINLILSRNNSLRSLVYDTDLTSETFYPSTSSSAALGKSANKWSDLWMSGNAYLGAYASGTTGIRISPGGISMSGAGQIMIGGIQQSYYGTIITNDYTNLALYSGYGNGGGGKIGSTINSGASLQNIFDNGSGGASFAGNVGIGTTAPSSKLSVEGGNINGVDPYLWNAQTRGVKSVVDGLLATWTNSDATNHKNVGYGKGSVKVIDGPINWTDITTTRPAGVNSTYINVRYTGWIKADYSETYTFYTNSDDGSRMWVNNTLIVDNWYDQGPTERSGTIALTAGTWYPIVIEYYQGVGGGSLSASWSSTSVTKALIPADHMQPTGVVDYPWVPNSNNISYMSGKVGIGNTGPSYLLQVGSSSVSGITARFQNSTGTCDINPTTSTLSCSSDLNLKKNINTLDGREFVLQTIPDITLADLNNNNIILRKINNLTPVVYNWKTESDEEKKHVGFIAQELEQIFPDLVSTDPVTGLKSIGYANLTPYLVKSVQEMNLMMTDINNFKPEDIENDTNPWRKALTAWLGNAANKVTRIFTGEICLTDTDGQTECINRSELKSLKNLLNTSGTASVGGAVSGGGSSTGGTDGTIDTSGTGGTTDTGTTDGAASGDTSGTTGTTDGAASGTSGGTTEGSGGGEASATGSTTGTEAPVDATPADPSAGAAADPAPSTPTE